MESINKLYIIILVLYYLFYIGVVLYLYFKLSRPYPGKPLERFNKNIPEKLNPIELSILIHHKIVPQVYTATILYLINIKALLKTKEKGKLCLTINNDFSGKLSHSQQYVLDFLIKIVGDNKRVTFKEINEYCDDANGASTFLLNYDVWKRMATKEGSKKQFFEPKTHYMLASWTRNIGLILFILNIILGVHSYLGYFVIIPALFIVFYFSKVYKRTQKYNEQFYLWLEYGNYMKHINELGYEAKDINTILIYSIILDKLEYVEPHLCDNNDLSILNNYILRCYSRSFLHGSRKLFK